MNMSDHQHHEKCKKLFSQLSEYLDRELDEQTCSEIDAHLDGCLPCRACMETLKKTVNICQNLDEEDVPPDFSERLRALIGQFAAGGGKG
jgi:RNA polymerase sigma-70 factor (ECF subfamily)